MVCGGSWSVRFEVHVDWQTLHLRGAGHPRLLTLPWRGWVYCMVPEAHFFSGMLTGPEAFLELLGMSELWAQCPDSHLKKALCQTCYDW